MGGDKEVIIRGNVKEEIAQDKYESVKGEKQIHIQGSLTQNVESSMSTNIAQNYTLISNESATMQSYKAMSLIANENLSLEADSLNSEIQSDYSLNVGNEATIKVNETMISAKGDCVIIKAGGVEVIIDSNGLIVKGGEIKSE